MEEIENFPLYKAAYIATFPTADGRGKEYRVAVCENIENCWYPHDEKLADAYIVMKFGKSQVFTNKKLAQEQVRKLALSDGMCFVLEFGVQELSPFKEPFPSMTYEEASLFLDSWWKKWRVREEIWKIKSLGA